MRECIQNSSSISFELLLGGLDRDASWFLGHEQLDHGPIAIIPMSGIRMGGSLGEILVI
jgi:hypothetical protein